MCTLHRHLRARVSLDAEVTALVGAKVATLGRSEVAVRALVGLLSRVGALVDPDLPSVP